MDYCLITYDSVWACGVVQNIWDDTLQLSGELYVSGELSGELYVTPSGMFM